MSAVRALSKPRFEALLYRRDPLVELVFEELERWSNADETVIATLGLDRIDHDFSWAILGRDETGVFRAFDTNASVPTLDEARALLHTRIEAISATNAKEFPQGDNDRRKQEILVPCVASKKLHPNFQTLLDGPGYSAARGLLAELSFAFKDRDGNFRKDFQTTGFDGRLWEIYLYAYLYEQRFRVDDKQPVPDFIAEKGGARIAIEAVTVNPTPGVAPRVPKTTAEEFELSRDYMPIKWAGPLTAKLGKQYWKQTQIAGLPLVIAIHDFHGPGSMTWSIWALNDYLYGVRSQPDERLVKVESHTLGKKTIPSGFFSLPEAENISAVIASNEATLPKFARIGKIAGFGDHKVKLTRIGATLDLEIMALSRFSNEAEVGVASETWSTGIWIFHNPNAKILLHPGLFEDSLNVFYRDGQREYFSTRRSHIIRSKTAIQWSD